MSRINLLKTRVTPNTEVGYEEATGIDFRPSGDQSEVFQKLLTLAIFVVGLVGYEYYNIGSLQSEAARIQAETSRVEGELNQKRAAGKKAEAAQKEIKALEEKIKILKKLSRRRLREIKILDYMQGIIPERVWINSLKSENDELEILGLAVTDEDLSQFLKRIEDKPYFREVILKESKDQKTEKGSFKTFRITCKMEMPE